MALYALTIFLSAFLLFQVQPLVGRFILPWFGGTPAVWNTCMLFFQILLLGGYTYAHLLVSKLTRRQQGMVHLGMMLLALVALATSFPPSPSWKPGPDDNPIVRIMLLLGFCIGVPYLLISSTGPLLQDWFAHAHPGVSPYRLYSLSNIGSLLALVTYPFLFEPYLSLRVQAWLWAIGYVIFAGVCGACACKLLKEPDSPPAADGPAAKLAAAKKAASSAAESAPQARPSVMDMTLWLALPACGSAALLATTNQLCQDVAVVPFLWVLPLSLYLLSFIICFDNQEWYARSWFVVALALAVFAGTVVLKQGVSLADFSITLADNGLLSWMDGFSETWPFSLVIEKGKFEIDSLVMQVVVYSFVLFSCCMCCHGELVHMKPSSKYLTLFYLMVSLGGALGGLFVAVGAPMMFNGFWEYPVCLIACCGLMAAVVFRDFLKGYSTGLGVVEISLLTALVSLTVLFGLAPGGLKLLEGALAKGDVWMFKSGYEPYSKFFRDPARMTQMAFWLLPQIVAVGWTWLALRRDSLAKPMTIVVTIASLAFCLGFLQLLVALLASMVEGATPLIPKFFAWGWNDDERGGQIFRGVLFMGLAGLGVWTAMEYKNIGFRALLAGLMATVTIVGFGKLSYELADFVVDTDSSAVAMTRNFYGVLRILDNDPQRDPDNKQTPWHKYTLMHGRITHGFQFTEEKRQDWHTSYYAPESAIGIACDYHPQRLARKQLRIGVIGLGTGTMATYAERGDYLRFYDINQAVVDIADQWFTYRQRAKERGADVDVFMGDARIVMERQLEAGQSQKFDILVVDAFSSDAIPVHLLTKECCAIYWQHLKPDGILAVHVSNRYLDLKPVVRQLALDYQKEAIWVDNSGDDDRGTDGSSWILVTDNKDFLAEPELHKVHADWDKDGPSRPLIGWTDDFSSIWPLLQLE